MKIITNTIIAEVVKQSFGLMKAVYLDFLEKSKITNEIVFQFYFILKIYAVNPKYWFDETLILSVRKDKTDNFSFYLIYNSLNYPKKLSNLAKYKFLIRQINLKST